jgi:hypothetical protein
MTLNFKRISQVFRNSGHIVLIQSLWISLSRVLGLRCILLQTPLRLHYKQNIKRVKQEPQLVLRAHYSCTEFCFRRSL